jgi:hypothetical protein
MRRVRVAFASVLLFYGSPSLAQADCDARQILKSDSCNGDELDAAERQLAFLINEYRAQHGLPAIAFSPALSLVANRHVRDMALNLHRPTHDWSNCPMSQSWECMWNAPQVLGTRYPGNGYENAFAGRADADIDVAQILRTWKEEGEATRPHNDLILGRGMWKDSTWQALGIGIYQGYAVMWVGREVDPTP